jgi:ubiquinone/menaquinone biosynthesis C-methylase UbiE
MSDTQPGKELPGSIKAFNDAATFLERLPGRKSFKVFSGWVKSLTRAFYNLISYFDLGDNLTFMNYGYISFDSNSPALSLLPEDEKYRFQIQMYDHIAGQIDWDGKEALEVGSGRGGGAAYIKRHFQPKSMTGVDLSDRAVAFCSRHHSGVDGLRFIQGDAEALKFPDESFDIIINVESSLYYPNVETFFKQVDRILKPDGYFLYADMRFLEEVENWRSQLMATGLELLSEQDVTRNAKRALSLNQEYRRGLIKKYVPGVFRLIFYRFGGADGGRLADDIPGHGERVYKIFVLRKPKS